MLMLLMRLTGHHFHRFGPIIVTGFDAAAVVAIVIAAHGNFLGHRAKEHGRRLGVASLEATPLLRRLLRGHVGAVGDLEADASAVERWKLLLIMSLGNVSVGVTVSAQRSMLHGAARRSSRGGGRHHGCQRRGQRL